MGVGIGICLLIFLFVRNEWTYDSFHTNEDRIYRAWVKEYFKGDIFFNSVTPYLLGTELESNFPEIDKMARYLTINSLSKKDERVYEENVHLVDPDFFDIFDFKILEGDKEALAQMHHTIITPEIARKYFGTYSPIGKILTLQVGGTWTDFTIQGIAEKPPGNSSIDYDILIPFENTTTYMSEGGRRCWTCVSVETYVMLGADQKIDEFTAEVAPFIDKKVADDYEPGKYIVGFQPLTDIHLNDKIPAGIASVSDPRYPYILSGIALLILLLACINFTSLAIGRSVSRSREVGIRKVSGANRHQLMFQFWSEAGLTVLAGMSLGILIARMGLPAFNQLSGQQLDFQIDGQLFIYLLVLFLITALLAGIYPAYVLSGFKPIQALKGVTSKTGTTKGTLLTWMVGAQFVLSIVLIICTGIMQHQMRYLQNKNLGFKKSHILTFSYDVSGQRLSEVWEAGTQASERLKNLIQGQSAIIGQSLSSHALGSAGWLQLGYTDQETQRFRNFKALQIDESFIPLMEIKLQDGRNFSKEISTDNKAVIINQAMINAFDINDPIGNTLPEPFQEYTIIGITEDFHFSSLHSPVDPLVMSYDLIPMIQTASDLTYGDPLNPKISVKVLPDNLQSTVRSIEKAWAEVAPEQSFAYSFIEDDINVLYQREAKLSAILSLATTLALLIACMGLFGISALKIAYKRKEIGIRKVLGASTPSILGWLSADYIKIILLAAIIASPLAWMVMKKWLEDFAFHVTIEWWIFLLAALLTLMIALLAVSMQSIKASLANPVNSLRDE